MAKKTGNKYDAIINAAIKVIAEKGYHNAQVAKIAKEAGVADGTIYLYFKNKEDILISVFRTKMNDFTKKVQKELTKIDNPAEKLVKLIEMHFSHLESDRNLALVTQIELRQSNPSIRVAIAEPLKQYYRLIEKVVEEGKEKGAFRDNIETRLARKVIFGALDEVATCWVLSSKRYKLTNYTRPVHNMLMHGLA